VGCSGVLGGFYRDRGAPKRGGRSNGGVNGFNTIEDGGEVKRGIKGGSDGGAVMARVASRGAERAARGAAAQWNLVATRPGSAGVRWKTELTGGARLTERRERSDQLRRREPKGKTYFRKDATNARARWVGEDGFGLRGERGQRGRLGQRPSGPVRLAGLKAKKKDF
jgi:hypothetical protein